MSLDLIDDKSTLVQVMAWCRQAASHYLSQCWPRSMSPNGVTGPQCVNSWTLIHSPGTEWKHENLQTEFWNVFLKMKILDWVIKLTHWPLGALNEIGTVLSKSFCYTRIFQEKRVNGNAVDALALCVTRTSAAVLLTRNNSCWCPGDSRSQGINIWPSSR